MGGLVEKDQGASKGQERSAEALWRRQRSLLPLPAPSVLLDVAQRSQALQEGRVGIVPHWEQPVSHRETQVVLVELDEGRVELRSFAHVACKGICLELKPATQDCQTEGQELQKQNIINISSAAQKPPETIFINPTFTSLYGEKMNWKIIIKPINVGWVSSKPKATNSSLRPIKTANREKHKKEFICRKTQVNLHINIYIWWCIIRLKCCFVTTQTLEEKSDRKTIHHLTDDDILDSMAKLPVTKLMTQYCKDLWVVASLFLVLWEYL